MEKIVYDNGIGSLKVDYDGDLFEFTQELDGDIVGQINIYNDEAEDLIKILQAMLKGE